MNHLLLLSETGSYYYHRCNAYVIIHAEYHNDNHDIDNCSYGDFVCLGKMSASINTVYWCLFFFISSSYQFFFIALYNEFIYLIALISSTPYIYLFILVLITFLNSCLHMLYKYMWLDYWLSHFKWKSSVFNHVKVLLILKSVCFLFFFKKGDHQHEQTKTTVTKYILNIHFWLTKSTVYDADSSFLHLDMCKVEAWNC